MAAQPTTPPRRRIRRAPAVAQKEILDAAEAILAERPFRDLSVDDLMARTGMTRSTFYHHFRSLDDVATGLLRRVQAQMLAAAAPWMRVDESEDPVASVRRAIRAVAEVYAANGPVLAAIHEASYHHDAVRQAWREGVLDEWIRAVAEQLRIQREQGVTTLEDPEEIARALLLMNTAVFIERLGTRPADSPEAVADLLATVWVRTIYG